MESGWIRRYPAMPGFLLEQSTTSRWVFRRYPVVTRPLAEVATTTSDGVAVLRPEIALLFKAKATRFKDQGDFDRVSPTWTRPHECGWRRPWSRPIPGTPGGTGCDHRHGIDGQ